MTSEHPRAPRRRRRLLDADEHRLWKAVARTIKPLRPPEAETATEEPAPVAAPPARKPPPKFVKPVKPPSAATTPPARPAPPGLAPLARRERQRLARGAAAIDARIDLHGLTQSQAHAALMRFLRRAQADGARFVLVITGKGARFADDGGERGVLRRQVPLWLRLPEFRSLVVGFEDAHAAHGGEGALYVRLRRARA